MAASCIVSEKKRDISRKSRLIHIIIINNINNNTLLHNNNPANGCEFSRCFFATEPYQWPRPIRQCKEIEQKSSVYSQLARDRQTDRIVWNLQPRYAYFDTKLTWHDRRKCDLNSGVLTTYTLAKKYRRRRHHLAPSRNQRRTSVPLSYIWSQRLWLDLFRGRSRQRERSP